MRALILLIRIVDGLSSRLVMVLFRVQQLVTGLLPALVPPAELTRLMRAHYERNYRNVSTQYPEHSSIWALEPWEEEVLTRHMSGSGTVLVLGTGVGRESIAIAERGYRVLGLDINREALRWAGQRTRTKGGQAWFVQASFLAIPTLPARVDYIFLPRVMYSAIPGRRERQAWLRNLRTHLKERGLAILNFLILREPETRTDRLTLFLNRWLVTLPGANHSYQPGDTCAQGHFLHIFATDEEIRSELSEAGATIIELNWPDGFAVVSWLQ